MSCLHIHKAAHLPVSIKDACDCAGGPARGPRMVPTFQVPELPYNRAYFAVLHNGPRSQGLGHCHLLEYHFSEVSRKDCTVFPNISYTTKRAIFMYDFLSVLSALTLASLLSSSLPHSLQSCISGLSVPQVHSIALISTGRKTRLDWPGDLPHTPCRGVTFKPGF